MGGLLNNTLTDGILQKYLLPNLFNTDRRLIDKKASGKHQEALHRLSTQYGVTGYLTIFLHHLNAIDALRRNSSNQRKTMKNYGRNLKAAHTAYNCFAILLKQNLKKQKRYFPLAQELSYTMPDKENTIPVIQDNEFKLHPEFNKRIKGIINPTLWPMKFSVLTDKEAPAKLNTVGHIKSKGQIHLSTHTLSKFVNAPTP